MIYNRAVAACAPGIPVKKKENNTVRNDKWKAYCAFLKLNQHLRACDVYCRAMVFFLKCFFYFVHTHPRSAHPGCVAQNNAHWSLWNSITRCFIHAQDVSGCYSNTVVRGYVTLMGSKQDSWFLIALFHIKMKIFFFLQSHSVLHQASPSPCIIIAGLLKHTSGGSIRINRSVNGGPPCEKETRR